MKDWITNTKFILAIFIVYIHTHYSANLFPGNEIYANIDRGVRLLTGTAVPAFFALSAYLLFRNFQMEEYTRKLFSRVKGLLVPYLLVSLICSCYFTMIALFSGSKDVSFLEFIKSVIESRYNGPLWFLLTLFEFVLVAPAVYCWIKNTRTRGALLLIVCLYLLNILYTFSYSSIIFWSPLLVASSAIAVLEEEHIKICIPSWIGGGIWLYG